MPKLSLAKLERHLYSAADRLRQEGLNAATYKDYIFGLLFLKRCSDGFDAEHERIVGRRVEKGMIKDEAEEQYSENPDYISREFVEQSGGDPTNLRLCGQVNDASAWSICKLNMLLHGVPGADIQLEDTLLHPVHREAGELERFDRVIANPPFSQNYTKNNMEFPERFRWGWAPTTGKKGDLMFTQHMLAVCKSAGMVVTVMPHGVLFRGGAEKEIRRKFLEQDLIEAIIGLPPNLFYGASIPACILVMRPNLSGQSLNPNKPAERRGQVLFINADTEFHAGRAQNYLRPEHVEKIVSTFERFEDVPGYARRVPLHEIGGPANDWNLNIRRYVDNSPPPEPHDVRAHLLGGVPVAEVEAEQPLFDALGFDPAHAFAPHQLPSPSGRGAGGEGDSPSPPPSPQNGGERAGVRGQYLDFAPALTDRSAIRPLVENDRGVQARVQALREALTAWWTTHAPRLAELPKRRDLNTVRGEFLDSFVAALAPRVTLDRFKLAGVIATWWTDTLPDFKTLLENGFPGVIDGWVDAVADAVEDDDNAGPAFDPFGHKLVRRTMADYLERIAAARADIARLKGEKEAFEQSNAPDDLDEQELAAWNYAKDLERQAKELKAEHKEALKELKKLETAARKKIPPPLAGGGEGEGEGRGRGHTLSLALPLEGGGKTMPTCLEESRASLQPILDQLAAIEAALAPYEQSKTGLAAARARYRELTNRFVDELKARCGVLRGHEKQALVLDLFAQDVQRALEAAMAEKRQVLVWFIEGMWDKYRVTLTDVHNERAAIETRLFASLEQLGFMSGKR